MFDGSVLVDIGGDTVYDRSFGFAHAEFRVRHNDDTRFHLPSVLKALTDADVITIGRLVSHTSGIPHTNRQPWGDGSLSLTIVERLSELPLDYEPGTGEAYSNGGYAVLARILEIAGGGSTYSAKGDMQKFMRGIFRDDFIPADLRRNVMGVEDDGYLAQGRSPGFVAKVLYRPQDDVIVISLSNSYAVPSDWALAIANLATGKVSGNPWPELIPATEPVAADDPRIGRYQPSYSDEPTIVSLARFGTPMIGGADSAQNALIPLAGGNVLQPLYFQMCIQDDETRVFTCTMLSGEEAYTSTHTPISD